MNLTTMAELPTRLLIAAAAYEPSPGFDYDKIQPDPGAVPRSELFLSLINGVFWLSIAAVMFAVIGGVIALVVGPMLGSHHAADRAKVWLLRALVGGLILGSPTAIVKFLLAQ